MSARRLAISLVDGQLAVRDDARPAATFASLTLPDGRRIRVAQHLCGWLPGGDIDPLWATEDAARAAFADDSQAWLATLEAAATLTPSAPPAPLPVELGLALDAARRRLPDGWVDGPRRSSDGHHWEVVLSGASRLGSYVARGPTPTQAVRMFLRELSNRERSAG